MQLPDSVAQDILNKAAAEMGKGAGAVDKQKRFHDQIKISLDDLAFQKNADPIQFYSDAINGSQLLQSGIYKFELGLKELHRQAVAAGSDGRS